MTRIFLAIALTIFGIYGATAQHTKVGAAAPPVTLADAHGNAMQIPHLGEKVVAVFYSDPDAKDVVEPLSVELKKRRFPGDKYFSLGVVNCKDTWMPNSAMKAGIRNREKKEPKSVILLDEKNQLPKQWELGDCNNSIVVVIIGKDGKIKMVRPIHSKDDCRTAIEPIMKMLEAEVAKA